MGGVFLFIICIIAAAIYFNKQATENPCDASVVSQISEYLALSKRLSGPPYPFRDSQGLRLNNIIPLRVTGVTHKQATGDPQKIIPHLSSGNRLVLVPDPENKFDDTAIRVVTVNGQQIGWYPQKGLRSAEIYKSLVAKEDVYAAIDTIGRQGDRWWCTMKVYTYGKVE